MTSITTTKSYKGPFIAMVILLSLIGLITSINQQFQLPIKAAFLQNAGSYENTLSTFLVFAFFLAYLLIGPIAANYLEKHGYKKTLLVGISILGVSFLIFLASAIQYKMSIDSPINFHISDAVIPLSYFIFVFGSFVSGSGLTYLQASVNPYIVACDVKGTSAVQRQNIGGTGNSIMTTIGPLLVAYCIFNGKDGNQVDIQSIIIPMLILIVFLTILFIAVNKMQLPSIAKTEVSEGDQAKVRDLLGFRQLTLGAVAIFVYVGVEVCIGSNFNLYAKHDLGMTATEAAKMVTFYWGAMLVGRFLGSFTSHIKARTLLGISTAVAAILVIMAIYTRISWMLIAVGLFHSVMWGAIFSLAIDGLGKYTAKGTGFLMMAVVGGAILPFLQGYLADIFGKWEYTWYLVFAGELYMLFYALIGSRGKRIVE